jgi:hypothetical protein
MAAAKRGDALEDVAPAVGTQQNLSNLCSLDIYEKIGLTFYLSKKYVY